MAARPGLEELLEKIDSAAAAGSLTNDAPTNLKRWLTEDGFADYHDRLSQLVNDGEFGFLNDHFWETIPFGTGGRRGRMGELGSATINERTIAESAHGLAVYLKSVKGEGGSAAVAYDSRNNSKKFGQITATTLAAHGLKVFLFESHRSTPALSFAVRDLGCDVGVVISASHNPPSDNGFKAYWDTGAQVLPPHDKGIIDCVYQAGEVPSVAYDAAVDRGSIQIIGADVDERYLSAVCEITLSDARDVRVIYSPLHGVGETNVFAAAKRAGFENLSIFEPHRTADGNFPNVADNFPNPERTQVFDPIIEAAQAADDVVDLVLASDPDADRIGVVVRDGNGNYIPISGNQTGALITDYVLRKRQQQGTLGPQNFVVETLVTTPLTATIARSFGAKAVSDLLVGFKHIARAIDENGPEHFLFATEESIGFLAGQYCRDKDAAAGALYVLELAAELKAEGKTLLDQLDALYVQHGYHSELQLSRYFEGPAGRDQIQALMKALRSSSFSELAGIPFESVRDFNTLEVRSIPGNEVTDSINGPQGNLLMFQSADGPFNVTVAGRPSGTEPKIKFYLFGRAAQTSVDTLSESKVSGDQQLNDVMSALSSWIDETVT